MISLEIEAFMQQNHYGSQELKIDILQTAIVSAGLGFGSYIDRIISQLVGEKNCVVTPSFYLRRLFFGTCETFSHEDAWICCTIIKTLLSFFPQFPKNFKTLQYLENIS